MVLGKKGFIRILEVFLALTILFTVVDKVYISVPPRFEDPENLHRLSRYSKDIAFSLCYHGYLREEYVNDSLPPFDLNWTIPADLDYHIYLYSNGSNDHKLDDLVNESGNDPGNRVMATTSCIIAGYLVPDVLQYNVTDCEKGGVSCTSSIAESDETRVSLDADENLSVKFQDVDVGFRKLELVLEGNSSIAVGNTNIMIYNGTDFETIQSYAYSSIEENHTFIITPFLPDGNTQYSVTVNPGVSMSYDYAVLYVTTIQWGRIKIVYSPRKIVVGVWNK